MQEVRFGKNPNPGGVVPVEYLRRSDIANIFRVTTRTIARWEVKYGLPKPFRIGRTAYWLPEDLEKFTVAKIAEREAAK